MLSSILAFDAIQSRYWQHCKIICTVAACLRRARRISGPKRQDITGGWRKLHDEELHNLCCSVNAITATALRRTMWAEHVAGGEKYIQIFSPKASRNRSLGD
jgi:hypothetical protein